MNTLANEILYILVVLLYITIGSIAQTVYSCNASAACGCSKNSAVLSRIVGGETANASTWGWAVSISIDDNYLCGGSIISSSWILTAAHCVNGYSAEKVTIYAGSTRRWTGSQTRVVSQIIIHASYDTDTYENDIALLKLGTALTMSDTAISTICLPSVSSATLAAGEWPAAGTTVVAVGWGTLSEGGSLPSKLQQVTLQTISYQASSCSSSITDWHIQLCAGVSGGGKDTCQGDSGGPLVMFSSSKQWVLVGLTSNGIGCAQANYAGIYTRVAAYEDWLNVAMSSSNRLTQRKTKSLLFLLSLLLSVLF
ncbi:unnamed protein product [Adineta ricciae]|uniref:Peptidase S1 domain-containing protein n=1 Tax=Adineta ricciae TaxID=249248 RepID=A0A815YXG2_ADIRI|nr:unnamed protein product [Adineta ricciae]